MSSDIDLRPVWRDRVSMHKGRDWFFTDTLPGVRWPISQLRREEIDIVLYTGELPDVTESDVLDLINGLIIRLPESVGLSQKQLLISNVPDYIYDVEKGGFVEYKT